MLRLRSSSPFSLLLVPVLAACGGGESPPGPGGSGGSGGHAGAPAWSVPACTAVSGTAGVTFTLDEGRTLAPLTDLAPDPAHPSPEANLVSTKGLVALDVPNTLLAQRGGQIYRSEDAGCSWAPVGLIHGELTLARASGDRAFAYDANSDDLYRIDDKTITPLTSPVTDIIGLAVDPAQRDRVRLVDLKGGVWESLDAGKTWTASAAPPLAVDDELARANKAAFAPDDLDHIVLGRSSAGAMTTADGGKTWTAATGLSAYPTSVNSIVFAPTDGQVVWASGVDEGTIDGTVPMTHPIWRSADGGRTFTRVVESSPTIFIRNQELLAGHPEDSGVLYFYFGAPSTGDGTYVYRYEHATGAVTIAHDEALDVKSVAFDPADARVMYLGLVAQE